MLGPGRSHRRLVGQQREVLVLPGGADHVVAVGERVDLLGGIGPVLADVRVLLLEQVHGRIELVIVEKRLGGLKRSVYAYDRRVAGIVSGANGINSGIILSQPGVNEGGQNVAISGRVYVQADASKEPIEPGDLLTTSDVPGCAMKVIDNTRAQGAIIGKAMSTLGEGSGMVLVLVSLQ